MTPTAIDPMELAWAAGLFDGEGCFTEVHANVNGRTYIQHRAKLNMVDEDVVRRFHRAVNGIGTVIVVAPRQPHHLIQYQWSVGRFELFQATIALLWNRLSAPKKQKAIQMLLNAKNRNWKG